MERIKLSSTSREGAGRGLNRLRKGGIVPAVVYGRKMEPKIIQVLLKDLDDATKKEAGFNAIFDLSIDGKVEGLVRIRDYQAHPLKRVFTHVDFQAIDLKEAIEVEVPVHLIGKAEGVKLGGVLEQQRRSLLLRCLVTDIPEHIEVDISALQIGESIHADDLKLPQGVSFPHETNFTIVGVVPPAKEEESAPALVEAAPAEGAVTAAPLPAEEAKTTEKKEGTTAKKKE